MRFPPRVVLALIVGSAPMSALAACPTPFGSTCAVNGTDVCAMVGSTWTCDVSFSNDNAECTVVSDYDTGSEYEAWGSVWVPDGGGGLTQEFFCCESYQNSPTAVHIEGSGFADLLQFTWDALAYNLAGVSAPITGTIDGNDGADIINGSHASASFSETLNGGPGNDTIRGNGGADTLNGNGGDDVMMGLDGDDTMNGGPGSDTMLGGAGNDTMNGDDGRDFMSGGNGNDTMDGGSGGDVLCGDAETGGGGDYLDDGDSTDESPGPTDVLFGANPADTVRCQDTVGTKWDGFSFPLGCDITPNPTTGPLPPAECP